MNQRHKYFVMLRVDHSTREECIAELEKLFFRLKSDGWPKEGLTKSGEAPRPRTVYDLGAIVPSIEDRIRALETEFDLRLGGISEENAA